MQVNHLPLAGRLRHCSINWEKITTDSRMLETVQGLRLKRVSMGLSVWRETSKKLTVCREKGKKLTVCRDYFCSDNRVIRRGYQWG